MVSCKGFIAVTSTALFSALVVMFSCSNTGDKEPVNPVTPSGATTYTLSVSGSPANGGTVSCFPNKTAYSAGDTVMVTADAAKNYDFTKWSGSETSTKPTVKIVMDGNKTLIANFGPQSTTPPVGSGGYILTTNVYSVGSGTITRSPDLKSYPAGSVVIVTAIAARNYKFDHWTGTITSKDTAIAILMNKDETLTARFERFSVKIGNQTWMAKNMDIEIGNSWCPGNTDSNCVKYGRLYDWETAKTVCPTGWRLPDTADWNRLADAIGGAEVAGKKLKTKSGWIDRDDGTSGSGTDEFGFSALPSGEVINEQYLDYLVSSYWWTAVEASETWAYYRKIRYSHDRLFEESFGKAVGHSVRCIQN